MHRSLFLTAGLAALLFCNPATAQPPTQLKWNLNKGNNFALEAKIDVAQTMTVQGQQIKQDQKQIYYLSYHPFGKHGQDWLVTQKFDRIVAEVDMGGNKITFDSAKNAPAGDPMSKLFAAVVGTELELTLDQNYKITHVRGLERLKEKVAAANVGADAATLQLYNESTFKQLSTFFQAVPSQPVTKGDRWNDQGTIDMGPLGSFKQLNRYIYEGMEGKLQKINVEPALTYVPPGPNPAGGQPFMIKNANLVSSGAQGKVLFDNDRGIVHSMEQSLHLNGKMQIDIAGQATEVELSQTQKTVIRLQ